MVPKIFWVTLQPWQHLAEDVCGITTYSNISLIITMSLNVKYNEPVDKEVREAIKWLNNNKYASFEIEAELFK